MYSKSLSEKCKIPVLKIIFGIISGRNQDKIPPESKRQKSFRSTKKLTVTAR